MTLYTFVKLDLNERMAVVNRSGLFVTNERKTHSNFYMVDDF